ncbi:pentapeptide repeat-containing protein [Symbioplanes lichenis]|uniref:pentapeptide repeat-containing protein n=1 Tax=Symbioplanes lichenis TaxID=1629072 RepID=UPI002739AB8C|nr:pentapeptide repeat-containing protein [Actinoplanes lichenis]
MTTERFHSLPAADLPPAPSPLEVANNRIRDAAKWLVASSAAVGAAMLAGSQLSDIGELPPALPDSVEHARLWVAVLGAVLALTSVVFAIWTAVRILLPQLIHLSDLAEAWDAPGRAMAPVVQQFRRNPKYLQGFPAPAELARRREELVRQQREEAAEPTDPARVVAAIADVDERITAVEDIATHEALKTQFGRAMRRFVAAAAIAATGIVAFAWAANPPDKTPVADLRNGRFTGSVLRDADLTNAKLDHADFTGADLTGADLTGASVTGVVWSRTICPDGTRSDVDGTCAGHLSPE